MSNIVNAVFDGSRRKAITCPLFQYDYGQIMKISGIELPASYQVQFSNTEDAGVSKTMLGDADGVQIPDEYLLTGDYIYAFVYLHETEDDGETEYVIEIPVIRRPVPSEETPTPAEQSLIDQLLEQLNQGVEAAEAAADQAGQAAETAVAGMIDDTLTIQGKAADAKATGDEITQLKADLSQFREEETIWGDINSPTRIANYRIATSGNAYEDSTGSILYWNIPVTGTYKFQISTTSNTYWGVYDVSIESTSDIVSSNRVKGYAGGSTKTYDLTAGQSVAVSARSTSFTGQGEKQETLVKLADNLGLTGEMESQVDTKIRESNQTETYYGLSTDSNFYVDKVPSYYIDPPDTIESFDDVYGYLDNKIASIPKEGKHFIFITDTHWDGNEKHSPDLIAYIRERTGINKVLFGGDAFGNAANKYLAAKKANGYLLPSKRSCGYELICCVGDHDNNTVNVDKDASHFLPYSEVEKLFVGDIEGSSSYHWYDCREKLANFATVGSDDYNEAVAFFHTVYYVDDSTQSIRYIVLNCGNGGNYGAMYNIFGDSGTPLLRLQFDWLAETLMTTPSGWDIVVLSHKGNTAFAGVGGDILNDILYSFRTKNANASGAPSSSTPAIESWWPHNWAYNFGSAPDIRFLITVNGHTHNDRLAYWGRTNGTYSREETIISSGSTINQVNGTADNEQIPIIITNCDSLGVAEASSPSMTAGTVTEQCFDVITITDTGLVLTRIGAGDDRSLTITRNVT